MENVTKIRRSHPPTFKTKVAIEMLKQQKTIQQICQEYGIHSSQASKWKAKALEMLEHGFADEMKVNAEIKDQSELIADLYQKIGQATIEIEWLKKKLLI